MDILAGLELVNWYAILAATVAAFIVGGIWYTPKLFGNAWMRYEGLDENAIQGANMFLIMGGSFITIFIKATVISLLIGGSGLISGTLFGALIGIGIITMNTAMHFLYARKSMGHILVEVGYDIVTFIVIGAIVGGR